MLHAAVAAIYVPMPVGVTFHFGVDRRQSNVATLTRIELINEGP